MDHGGPRKKRRLSSLDSTPYVLKDILPDIPLDPDGNSDQQLVSITCVEYWNNNLYIGTSASEILHMVALPSEDDSELPMFILASRLQPSGHASPSLQEPAGVHQILVLPGPMRACVLCNGTVSFYSLPELTPASPNKELTGVQWIGGVDETAGRDDPEGVVVMIAIARKIMLVRVGDKPRLIKNNIEYPACLRSSRRDTIACVADDKGYALVEIEHHQKIPLFPISSIPDSKPPLPGANRPLSGRPESGGHSRSSSLGTFPAASVERRTSPEKGGLRPGSASGRNVSPSEGHDPRSQARPRSSTEAALAGTATPGTIATRLRPHVLSPFPNEFMLTTGTTSSDPGVGMFVNLDGEVARGTIDFDQYPEDVLAYDFRAENGAVLGTGEHTTILALCRRNRTSSAESLLFQTLHGAASQEGVVKSWVDFTSSQLQKNVSGLHCCLSLHQYSFVEVAELLQAVRFRFRFRFLETPTNKSQKDPRTQSSLKTVEQQIPVFESRSDSTLSPSPDYVQRRQTEELSFVRRMGQVKTHAIVWSGGSLWQILPNPLLLQLEHELCNEALSEEGQYDFQDLNVSKLITTLGKIRDRDPLSETEFWSMKYIKQKGSLILFLHLLTTLNDRSDLERASRLAGDTLYDSELDARIVLLLLPPLAEEVLRGPNDIWIHRGIVDCVENFVSTVNSFTDAPPEFWMMVRQYLTRWQEKRGYGSIPDEQYVFDSVDASLLRLLLYLDQGPVLEGGSQAPIRLKLYNTVDHWKGDFARAIALLEQHRRLYVLSRLYQSRKQSKEVLATWKRIGEGEKDADDSISPQTVLAPMRSYLIRIRDVDIVREYALWLATQDTNLAVQIFADDSSRVRFEPAQVVSMLKDHAPHAVQQYLEHLVFAKRLDQYADDLVGYYLNSVVDVLRESEEARQSLADSYATYRAMEPPKPTYLDFISQNAPPQPWWQSRLRLLQLLGSGGYADTEAKELTYSIDLVLERLAPFSSFLVSESIILDARQGRHKEALRLLVHGLGDYDTATRYCYFGGPNSPARTIDASLLPPRETQTDLFNFLFQEFLKVEGEDEDEKIERTSHLLGTFASWFDPLKILEQVPQDWTVDALAEFLLRSLRAATTERNEAMIRKALSAAQNLQSQAHLIEVCEKFGPKVESEKGDTSGTGAGDAERTGEGDGKDRNGPGPAIDEIQVS